MTFKTNLIPHANNSDQLGSSTAGWKIEKLNLPTTSNGSTFGPGSEGQVLTTNGNKIYWDTVTAGVSGVKGSAEDEYRTGNVNISPENIGLENVENVALSTWAGSSNITTIGTISSGTVPLARVGDADDLKAIEALSGTAGILKKTSANNWTLDTATYVTSSGVTSVQVQGAAPVTSTVSTVQTGSLSTTIGLADGYGDTKNPYAAKNINLVLASPASGSASAPGFRQLVVNDLPVVDILHGGTGKTVASSAWAALGGGTAGKINLNSSGTTYLSGSGTWTTPPGTYILPAATANAIGGVKVSSSTNGLTLNAGDLSVDWSKAPVKSVNSKTGDVVLADLKIGNKTYNGAATVVVAIADLGLASPMTFRGVTDTALADGSIITPVNIIGGATPGSYTPVTGDVVLQSDEKIEYIYDGTQWHSLGIASSYSLAEHSHGYILNDGAIHTSITAAYNDRLVLTDASDSGRLAASSFTFDTTSTQAALSKAGDWVDYLQISGGTMTGAVKTNGLIGTESVDYGDILPATATEGQIFFQLSYGENEIAIPAGGTAGYALMKNSNADGDLKWGDTGVTGKVAKAGDTMTGNLTLSESQIVKAGTSVSWYQGRNTAAIKTTSFAGYNALYSIKTAAGDWSCGVYTDNKLYWTYITDANYNANSNSVTGQMRLEPNGYLYTTRTYGAVWNDYAEFRQTDVTEPGRVIKENGDDTLSLAMKRLERGCEIISDTFGFAIGETEKAKVPTAASGRVLAYPYENRDEFRRHIGWPVCSGPYGTVSIMTEEEEEKYPSRIIGTISAVPDYEFWLGGDKNATPIKVNGRVWIRVR